MRSSVLFVFASVAALSVGARAQCRDWKDGFGTPGLGLGATCRDAVQFDDGGGNRIYVASGFVAGGQIASWDGTSWSPTFDTINHDVRALAVYDDGSGPALHMAGQFVTVNGTTQVRASKRVGTTWQPLGAGVGSLFDQFDRANALCVHDDGTGAKLYVGGRFQEAGGVAASYVAVWNGTAWSALGSGVDGEVNELASYAGKLYVAGNFANAGGAPALRLASWDGAAWSTVGPTLGVGAGSPQVNALHVADLGGGPRLYVAGQITTLGGQPCSQLLAWDGSAFTQIPLTAPGFNGATAIGTHDDGSGVGLYLAGRFATIDGIAVNGIARWNGAAWSGLQGGYSTNSATTYSIQSFQGDLYAFGDFTTAGGKPSHRVGVWSVPCAAPGFLQQPSDATATWGTDPVFSVRGSGLHPLAYQWYRDGVALQDSSAMTGTQTREMRIFHWSYGDRGQYTCVLTNALGSTESDPGELIVPAGGQSGIPVTVAPTLDVPATASGLQPGETITSFAGARRGWTGEILSHGTVGGDAMPFLRENGAWRLLLRRFDAAPGMPAGTTFGRAFGGPLVGEQLMGMNSSVMLEAYVAGPGFNASNDKGYWFSDASGLALIAYPSSPAPGTTPGATLQFLRFPSLRNDRVHFQAEAYLGSTFLHTGIWSWDRTNGLQLVLQPGMTAPGTGSTFDPIYHGCGATEAGEIVFVGAFGGGQTGLFAGPAASLQLLQRTGDPQPGHPSGVAITAFEALVYHDVDDMAVVTNSPQGATQRRSLHTIRQGVVNPILQTGSSAPDSGIMTFFSPRPVAMNAGGSVLIYSNLAGQCETCPSFGVWLADASGNLTTILVNRGQTIPGLQPGHIVTDIGAMALDDSERVLISVRSQFAGTYNALYGWTRDAGLFPIATVGDQFEVAAGVYKTVRTSSLVTPNGTGNFGDAATLSDTGDFTFGLSFLDNTGGTYEGNFSTMLAAIVGSGTTFCVGDGTGTACPCGNHSTSGDAEGCANSLGHGGTLRVSGVPSLSNDTLTLVGAGMPNSSALYFQGTTQAGGGLGTVFGDGLRCASGTIRRLGTRTNSAGTSSVPAPGGPTISAIGPITSPGDRTYQVWYRNAASFCTTSTFNLTNGVLVTWSP